MKWPKEFFRYAVVGFAANVSGFLLFALFTAFGVSPVLTISIFYPVHIGIAFFFNKKWSFRFHGHLSGSAVRYLIAYAGCYVLNVAMLKFFNGFLGYSHLIVQAAAVVVIALLLFLAQKFWVFRAPDSSIPCERSL